MTHCDDLEAEEQSVERYVSELRRGRRLLSACTALLFAWFAFATWAVVVGHALAIAAALMGWCVTVLIGNVTERELQKFMSRRG